MVKLGESLAWRARNRYPGTAPFEQRLMLERLSNRFFPDFFCVFPLGDGYAGEVFLGSIVRGIGAGGGDVWLIWPGDCRDVK